MFSLAWTSSIELWAEPVIDMTHWLRTRRAKKSNQFFGDRPANLNRNSIKCLIELCIKQIKIIFQIEA